MPICPQCRHEYREGLKICPKCDVNLVDELPLAPEQEGKYFVSGKGAFIGNFILLVIASLISQGVESLPALAPVFRVIALIIGIPLALGAIGLMFSTFISNTREEAMFSQLMLTAIACLPVGLLTGLDSDKIPPAQGFVGSILSLLEFVFIGTWVITTGISLMKAVLAPWWRSITEELKRQEELQPERVEEQKVETLKLEEEIEEYPKAHELKVPYELEWTPELLQRLDAQDFQMVVAELFRRLGYHADVVGTGGPDEGVDILAEKEIPVRETLAIQCKRQEKPITAEKIREYSALYKLHDVDVVVLVTSSNFTTPARKEAERLKVRLLDGAELCRLLQEYLSDLLPKLEERPQG